VSKKLNNIINALSAFGIAANTSFFGFNLFTGQHNMAVFNLLCASCCWVGYYKFDAFNGENDGSE
jgi:hypothetical protein